MQRVATAHQYDTTAQPSASTFSMTPPPPSDYSSPTTARTAIQRYEGFRRVKARNRRRHPRLIQVRPDPPLPRQRLRQTHPFWRQYGPGSVGAVFQRSPRKVVRGSGFWPCSTTSCVTLRGGFFGRSSSSGSSVMFTSLGIGHCGGRSAWSSPITVPAPDATHAKTKKEKPQPSHRWRLRSRTRETSMQSSRLLSRDWRIDMVAASAYSETRVLRSG